MRERFYKIFVCETKEVDDYGWKCLMVFVILTIVLEKIENCWRKIVFEAAKSNEKREISTIQQ